MFSTCNIFAFSLPNKTTHRQLITTSSDRTTSLTLSWPCSTYTGYKGAPMIKQDLKLCLIMDKQFDSPDGVFGDNSRWFREVDMSGFGNGQFEMTTASDANSFVRNGTLYIAPTLTADSIGEDAIFDGYRTYRGDG
jgi:hypothetical protein